MNQSIRQYNLERDARLYKKLDVQIQKQISVLQNQVKDAKLKKESGKSEATRIAWLGMENAYSNALSELQLAYDRAHHSEKFKFERENNYSRG